MLKTKAINMDKFKNGEEESLIYRLWDLICNNEISYFLRKQGRFLKRIISWIPVLYNDEDWDYAYLLYIIDFKLKQIREVILDDDIHVDSSKTVKKIDIIRGRLDRYLNSEKYLGERPEREDTIFFNEDNDADGFLTMKELSPEYKEYLNNMTVMEEKNFRGFFRSLEKYLPFIWS